MPTHYKYAFTSADFQEMLMEFQQQMGPQATGASYRVEGNESAWELSQSFGTWSGQGIELRDGLDLWLVEWDMQEDLLLTAEAPMGSLFGLSFCVTGGFLTKFPGRTAEHVSCANEAYAGFFSGNVKSVTEMAAGKKTQLVQVRVNPHLFETLASASARSVSSRLDAAVGKHSNQTALENWSNHTRHDACLTSNSAVPLSWSDKTFLFGK